MCNKVSAAGTTTYNAVADQLVSEFGSMEASIAGSDGEIDEKNIRRRVYDALNVLEACGAISKMGKSISWIGWPRVRGCWVVRGGKSDGVRLWIQLVM